MHSFYEKNVKLRRQNSVGEKPQNEEVLGKLWA